jgi:hypothetical protein
VHPSRPAVDACPVCGRPRCGADAARIAVGCLACVNDNDGNANGAGPARRPPGDLERLVRAALAAYAVAVVGGPVGSEYVGATIFEYLGPLVVGVVCGGAATRAAGTHGHEPVGRVVRWLAAGLAVLGVGLSFVLEQSHDPLSVSPDVLLPYAAAVAGALLWTMPPRRRQGLSTDV